MSGLVGCSLLFYGVAAAQTYTPEAEPTYSETQIKEALTTCIAQAAMNAKANGQPFMKLFSYDTQTFTEQLENCVIWVLEGEPVEMMPLG